LPWSKDTSESGSSKFLLFPVATSILDSKSHTVFAAIFTLIAAGLTYIDGVSPYVLVPAAVLLYSLGLSAFEFGPTADFDANYYTHAILLTLAVVAVPFTTGVLYLRGWLGTANFDGVFVGILVFETWVLNRQLYMAAKEDTMDLGIRVPKGWLYLTRLPFVAVLATAALRSVPFIGWGLMAANSIVVANIYGFLRQFLADEHKALVPTVKRRSTDLDQTSPPRSNASSPASEPDVDPPSPDVESEKHEATYVESLDLTMQLHLAVRRVNSQLADRELDGYWLDEISFESVPPAKTDVRGLGEQAERLASHIESDAPDEVELYEAVDMSI
jgi:hypothetical protein